jgi:hypothetical protein
VKFTVTGMRVPTDASSAVQTVQVIKLPSIPPAYSSSTTTHTTLLYKKGVSGTGWIPCNIAVQKGDIIGVLGARGTTTMYNSYGTGPYASKILGTAVTLNRFIYQANLYSSQAGAVSSSSGSIGRVEMRYAP